MLQPASPFKGTKGHNTGIATRGNAVSFGDFGLKSTDRGRRRPARIEAARRCDFASRGGVGPYLDPWVPGQTDPYQTCRSPCW